MPKNILIDINVILDIFLKRPGYKASGEVVKLRNNFKYQLFISAHSITTLSYLLERDKQPQPIIATILSWSLHNFKTVAIDASLLQSALKSQVKDYVDAVIEQAAVKSGASFIITRNVKDFKLSQVPALTPEAFLSR